MESKIEYYESGKICFSFKPEKPLVFVLSDDINEDNVLNTCYINLASLDALWSKEDKMLEVQVDGGSVNITTLVQDKDFWNKFKNLSLKFDNYFWELANLTTTNEISELFLFNPDVNSLKVHVFNKDQFELLLNSADEEDEFVDENPEQKAS